MNTHFDWKELLKSANRELCRYGINIYVGDNDDKGFYKCLILKDGDVLETYAENFYENELDDLVTDAWNYALNKYAKK